MTSSLSNDLYLFKNNESDNLRLDRQYPIMQKSFDRVSVTLSNSLQEGRANKILDVAAGSLAWTLDVARSVEPSKVQLYACDITSDNFPPKSVADAFSITTFVHDVTQPFPEEMMDQFDVVNMRLLVLALTEDQWQVALKNLHNILRPGGHLHLFDFDAPFYTSKELVSTAVAPWPVPVNNIFLRHAQAVGYIPNLPERLPGMLRTTSFTIKEQLTCPIPFGITRKTYRSMKGASLEGDEVFTGELIKMIIDRVLAAALAGGHLEDGYGNPVTTEVGRRALLERFNKDLDNNGVLYRATQIIAVRN